MSGPSVEEPVRPDIVGRVAVIWPVLPRRVRLRLWWHHRVDRIACRLCDHGSAGTEAAILLWRACGMWTTTRPGALPEEDE